MLSTLFKHEMRANAKTFMWFYIAFVVIAVVNAIINPFAMESMNFASQSGDAAMVTAPIVFLPNAIRGVFMVLYSLSIGVISVLTIVLIILRFYKNLLGDEGYLMMTLPVTREQHILSKLLSAVIWSVCTTVLIFLSLVLMLASAGVLGDLIEGMNQMIAEGVPLNRWIVQIIALMLVSCVNGILMLYAAMGIGPNMLKNRVGGSILAFIILYIGSQFVMLAVTFSSMYSIFLNPQMMSATITKGPQVPDHVVAAVDTIFAGTIIGTAALAIAFWFITRYMIKRKLNLA